MLRVGDTILHYRIVRLIGTGGMGNVYEGVNVKNNQRVAIKVLHEILLGKSKIKNRFKNEAFILSRLKHKNIVTLLDYIEENNMACLVMEYVEGHTLEYYIKNISGPLPEEKLIPIFTQILSAIQFAHEQNIVHRDVKPANFIITQKGEIKILDFGIAKMLSAPDLNKTNVGARLGTVPYMSPEQVRGEPVDKTSDIYSLGVLLFFLATGISPYDKLEKEYKEFEIQDKIINENLPDPRKIYPNVPVFVSETIFKATRKDKNERFQSCTDFIEALTIPVVKKTESIKISQNKPKPKFPNKETQNSNTNVFTILAVIIILFFVFVLALTNYNSKTHHEETHTPPDTSQPYGSGSSQQQTSSQPSETDNSEQEDIQTIPPEKPFEMIMPDLTNMTLGNAVEELNRLGLSNIIKQYIPSGNSFKNKIINTTPVAGAQINDNEAKIVLIVGKGHPKLNRKNR